MLQHTKFETENLLDLGGYMNGAYYAIDDTYKIANYDKLLEENKKLKEENIMLKSDYNILTNAVRNKDKQYLKMIEERDKRIKELEKENSNLKSKQMSLEAL